MARLRKPLNRRKSAPASSRPMVISHETNPVLTRLLDTLGLNDQMMQETARLARALVESTDKAQRAARDLLSKANSMGMSEFRNYIRDHPVTDSHVLMQWALAFEATERVERGTKNLKNANQTRQEAADKAALDSVKGWSRSKAQPTANTVKRYLRTRPPDRRARRLRTMLKAGRIK